MGSLGVTSNRGRISNETVQSIQNLDTISGEFGRANTLVVFSGTRGQRSLTASEKRWRDILDLDNPSRGFAISMTGATAQQKRNFLRTLNTQGNNLRQNQETSYAEFANKQIARAESILGRPLRDSEKAVIREIAYSTKQRNLIDSIIANDRKNGNALFGGAIRTRRLTKRDFKNL